MLVFSVDMSDIYHVISACHFPSVITHEIRLVTWLGGSNSHQSFPWSCCNFYHTHCSSLGDWGYVAVVHAVCFRLYFSQGIQAHTVLMYHGDSTSEFLWGCRKLQFSLSPDWRRTPLLMESFCDLPFLATVDEYKNRSSLFMFNEKRKNKTMSGELAGSECLPFKSWPMTTQIKQRLLSRGEPNSVYSDRVFYSILPGLPFQISPWRHSDETHTHACTHSQKHQQLFKCVWRLRAERLGCSHWNLC